MNKIYLSKMTHSYFKFYSVANVKWRLLESFCTYKDVGLVEKYQLKLQVCFSIGTERRFAGVMQTVTLCW